jgi:hypothetical protein
MAENPGHSVPRLYAVKAAYTSTLTPEEQSCTVASAPDATVQRLGKPPNADTVAAIGGYKCIHF